MNIIKPISQTWEAYLQRSYRDVQDRENTVEVFTNLTSVSAPRKMTAKGKKKAMEESVEWLQNNEADLEEISNETLQTFTNMTGVSTPEKLNPKTNGQKAKEAIEWLRNNDVKLEDFPNKSLEVLESFTPPFQDLDVF